MAERLNVRVAFAMPEVQVEMGVEVPAGATVGDALAASGIASRFPGVDFASLRSGIWNKLKARDAVLRDGDRVEFYRSLKADPNTARQARVAKKRAAGKA
jgi:putative ubiquitin-RnfH superfamily antitoxin RatB of RatAB toxin-antitoxin module